MPEVLLVRAVVAEHVMLHVVLPEEMDLLQALVAVAEVQTVDLVALVVTVPPVSRF